VIIIGFCGDEPARFVDPPLTTVRIDLKLLGQIAAYPLTSVFGALMAKPGLQPFRRP
jgi:DNA-binding LacI/PurR family transcriptional regulator